MEPTPPQFEVYQGEDKQFYWRLVATNGQIIATGAEGYASHAGAVRATGTVTNAVLVIAAGEAAAANEDAALKSEQTAEPATPAEEEQPA